jgi:hypothetical protein
MQKKKIREFEAHAILLQNSRRYFVDISDGGIAQRGAETCWGFHESPIYPHMYCFLVWMERKNGI